MRQFTKLLAIFCVLALLSGCAVTGPADTATEKPFPTGTSDGQSYSIYFPDDATYLYSHDINPERVAHINEVIMTNTTKITVKNKGDFPIVANLYYPDDLDDVLMTNTIEPGKKLAFSGLTSALTYCIGFEADQTGKIEVSISG